MNAVALFLAAALALGIPAANAQEPKAAPTSTNAVVRPPEFGMPGVVSVAQLWKDFLASADEAAADREALIADDLITGKGEVDAAKCRARSDDLDRAARRVPIGFEIWYVRHACALALGDTKRADESERAMAALTRYEFAEIPPDHGASAIKVFQLGDAYAFVFASGETLIYDYFDLADRVNGNPLILGLRDPQTGRDRELRFDFVSSTVAIRRKGDDYDYPDERTGIARATIKSMAKDEKGTPESEAQALIEALELEPSASMQAILAQARSGSYTAATYASKCLWKKDAACAQQAIDALLPFAEKGDAHPMLLLALAYSTGRGVKQDPEAAKTLVKGAARRVGDGGAFGIYTGLGDLAGGQTPLDNWILEGLERSADGGDPFAAQIAAASSYLRRHETTGRLTPRERAWLEMAEHKGLHSAAAMLVLEAWKRKDAGEVSRYMLKWADQDAYVATALAAAYEDGSVAGIPRDPTLAFKWRRKAGMLGDIRSMRIVGAHYMNLDTADSDTQAIRWFYSAAATGDLDGTLDLALALTTTERLGADSLKKGIAIYREVLADKDSPRARREFAKLLIDGRGVDKDIVQARALLLKDAQKGDAESQLLMARALFAKKLGKNEPSEVWDWLRKADANGSRNAALWLASAMFNGADGMPVDRRKALDSFGKLTVGGSKSAANDYAWYLCTGPDAALRDPAKGLETISQLVKDAPNSTHFDTQASCLAATSNFAQAVDFQQRAIAALPPDSAKTLAGMQSRLALYRSGKAYVLDAANARDATTSPASSIK